MKALFSHAILVQTIPLNQSKSKQNNKLYATDMEIMKNYFPGFMKQEMSAFVWILRNFFLYFEECPLDNVWRTGSIPNKIHYSTHTNVYYFQFYLTYISYLKFLIEFILLQIPHLMITFTEVQYKLFHDLIQKFFA